MQHWQSRNFHLRGTSMENLMDDILLRKIFSILDPLFNKVQIKSIISKNKGLKHWEEDTASVMTLRSLGVKLCKYLLPVH